MNAYKVKIEKDVRLRQFLDLINRIAKVEYASINANHLIEYGELVNIGIQTVNILLDDSSFDEQKYNDSYISTAVKWAIRNELRRRYRWHGVKMTSVTGEQRQELREAVYKTILSTDELLEADRPFEVKDVRKTPEENVEFTQISNAIRQAISKLPKREKDLIKAKFYNNKKLHELSDEFTISPSRISRIIKSGLDKIKKELIKTDAL